MRIMNLLGEILEQKSNKHNFWSECFTCDAQEQYKTSVTNSLDDKDDVTKEYINADLNTVSNFTFPHNAALKYWSYILGVASNPEGMLVREFYAEMKAYIQ